ncbi:MAG: hypothetical protein LQ351_006281 [Letrouitia transgressa]|nr:MAG: hypothetical protein LQ351_006281 [Letrouitia transgressa]
MFRLIYFFHLLVSLLSFPIGRVLAQPLCNGHAEFCDRPYPNITFIGAHDSPFVGPGLSDNQNVDVTAQLNAGIRFLQGQTRLSPSETLNLCHTSCFLADAGPLATYLSTVKRWLDTHPNEVLTLLLTNPDNVPLDRFATAFKTSGIDQYAFLPPPQSPSPLPISQWPTLGNLIASKTRLIVFLDYGASPSSTSAPYLLDEFAYFFETPFDTTDPTFPQCALDRPPNGKPDGRMYIVNHFLDKEIDLFGQKVLVPDRAAAPRTNAAVGKGSITAQTDICEDLYGRTPAGVLVDFFDKGDVFRAQDLLNGF